MKHLSPRMTGVERIAAERKRQIEEEGWTAEHDDFWTSGELVKAALCYLMEPGINDDTGEYDKCVPDEWPWNPMYWKPSPENRIREMEKAGALISAEIDRLLRLNNGEES